jgi:hypothetical protein
MALYKRLRSEDNVRTRCKEEEEKLILYSVAMREGAILLANAGKWSIQECWARGSFLSN